MRVAGEVTVHSGDTIRFSVLTQVEPATAGDLACSARSSALVIAAPGDAQRLEVGRFSLVKSIVGFAALTAGVGVTILLLVSAADGLIDAVGRWF